MLKILRNKNITKVVLWAILILILPAFVIWGSGSLGGNRTKGPSHAGVIHGKKVSFDSLGQSLASIRSQIIMTYYMQPQVLEMFLKSKSFIVKMAWDRLIMLDEAQRRKIKISDKMVIAYIKSHPMFIRNNKFDDQIYEYALRRSMGVAPRAFEEMVRDNLKIQALTDIVTQDTKVTDADAMEEYAKDNEIFKLSYILVPSKGLVDAEKYDDKALSNYFTKHINEYTIPVDKGGVRKATPADLVVLKEKVRASLADEGSRAAVMVKADTVFAELKESMEKDKALFADAAVKLGLAVQETKFFSRHNKLDEAPEIQTTAIADMARALKPGELSRPAEAKDGAMIFVVAEMQKADPEKFAKSKEIYVKNIIDRRKNKGMEEWLRNAEKEAPLYIDPQEFDQRFGDA